MDLGSDGPGRILVAMPGPLAPLVALTLRHTQSEVRIAATLEESRRALATWKPHLLFVDFDLAPDALGLIPRTDGVRRPPAIAFMRGRDIRRKMAAFDSGAEDIIQTPYTPDELVGRAVMVMSRVHRVRLPLIPTISVGKLEVDILTQRARADGDEFVLSPTEHSLLYLLAANAGGQLDRELILDSIWGSLPAIGATIVEAHVAELNAKLRRHLAGDLAIEMAGHESYRLRLPAP